MNREVMRKTMMGSLEGSMSFPEIVRMLTEEGLESYHVDLVQGLNTYYMPNGDVHVEKLHFTGSGVAPESSMEKVVSAIRSSQAKRIGYREFLHEILAAGTTGYTVYIKGKKAIYFGRRGEFHVENFPQGM